MSEKFTSIVKVMTLCVVWTLTLAGLTTTVYAQSSTVKGVVKDSGGAPLVGVTVIVPGTTVGTTTSTDGSYSLKVPETAKQLRFGYVGYDDVVIDIAGKSEINVTMTESATQMEEVVVMGYGTQKKRDVTGSVVSINSKVLEAMPVSSVAEAMAGRLAGVQVTSTEGGPDAEIKIRVRGGGSISQDNSPLYIVDGFPVSSISDIAASDIERMDVLKDASATAIYGARGANGVIIITTKSGSEGKTTVNFNAYWGFKQITKTLDVLDAYEYVMWQYELANYKNSSIDYDSGFMKYYGAFDDLELYKNKKTTDWQDEIFGRTAFTQNYNVSVTGGTDKAKYNVSMSHIDDESIMIGAGYVRDNINAKFNINISKKIKLDFNARWSQTVVDGAGTSTEGSSSVARLKHAVKYAPTRGIADFVENDEEFMDEIESTSQLYNPVDITNDEYRQTTRRRQTYNGAFNWKVIDNLSFRSEWGVDFGEERTDRFYGESTSRARQYGNTASKYYKDSHTWRVANTLTWTPSLGENHDMTLLVGQETNSDNYNTMTVESRNLLSFLDREAALANMNLGTIQPTEQYLSAPNNLQSFFGRVNYSLKDRYLLTATMRADGSSKFAPGHRWGYFPSAAFGWRISEEKWMQNSRRWLDNLKLRVSYGAAGNNRIDDDLWRYIYETNSSSKPISINGTVQTIIRPNSTLPNPELKWETTITRNIGLDLGLWGSRLVATVDLYWNSTKDLLMAASVPSSTGFSIQYQNIGKTSNKGIEVVLDGVLVEKKDFRLSANFNVAFNRNRVDALGTSQSFIEPSHWYNSTNPIGDYYISVGQPVGQIYGFETLGMYTFEDFDITTDGSGNTTYTLKENVASSSSITGVRDMPGSLKLLDYDGSGTVTEADRKVIGNTMPVATGGFSLNMQWKGFDAGVYFNFVYGNDVYNANKLEFTTTPLTRKYGNLLSVMENRFTYIDRTTGQPLLNDPDALEAANKNATIWSPIITSVPVHSWAIEDGSFLRLNNVTIGYTLPQKISRKFCMERLRIYVTGYNLALFTKYSGYDPEVDAIRKTPLTPGIDYSAFPRARQFVAGINITF